MSDPPRCHHCALFRGSELTVRLDVARRVCPRRAPREARDLYLDPYLSTHHHYADYADWTFPARGYPRAPAAAGSSRALEISEWDEGGSLPRYEPSRSRSPQSDLGEQSRGRRRVSRSASPEEDDDEDITSYQPRREEGRDRGERSTFRVIDQVGHADEVPALDAPPGAQSAAAEPQALPVPPAPALPAAGAAPVVTDAGQPAPATEPTLLDVYKVATSRCGLKWPGDEVVASTPVLFQGENKPEDKPPKRSKLPQAQGFAAVLTSTWAEPADKSNNPKKTKFDIDFEGSDKIPLDKMPKMDLALTDVFLKDIARRGQKAPICINGNTPSFCTEADKQGSANTQKVYEAASACAKALNASAILQGSLKTLLDNDTASQDQVVEMRRIQQEIILLNRHSIEWTGRVLSLCVAHERARWLAHVSFTGPNDRQDILNVKITHDNLFPGAMRYMQDSLDAQRLHDEAARACLAQVKPKTPAQGSQPKQLYSKAAAKQKQREETPAPRSSSSSRDRQSDRREDDRPPSRGGRRPGRGGWSRGSHQPRK